ncbi:MAG: eCIS core domain-containing protein [Acidimicrobiales bacterium]
MGPVAEVAPIADVVRSPGEPLAQATRSVMERRFGHSLTDVRVHDDATAARSADALGALAYTVGRHVIFGAGHYRPQRAGGLALIAHELTHVLQQRGRAGPPTRVGDPGDPREREAVAVWRGASASPALAGSGEDGVVWPARYRMGSVGVDIDYGNVALVPYADHAAALESMFASWTGASAVSIQPQIAALTQSQRHWVLFALDLLIDNTTGVHAAFDRVQAVQRLITHAPRAAQVPSGPVPDFENEVLRVSGWFELGLSAGLTTPSATTLTTLHGLYNPAPGGAAGPLDVPELSRTLPPILTAVLSGLDPARWTSVGTQPLSTLQTIAAVIQAAARTFLAPWADTAMANRYTAGWQYSAQLFDVTARASDRAKRLNYLTNRAELIGRTSRAQLDTLLSNLGQTVPSGVLPTDSVFTDVDFDSSRPPDRTALAAIVQALEAQATVAATVDRLVQHTGVTERATDRVGVSTEFNLGSTTACAARWSTIDTLAHELVHSLVHPAFPPQAVNVGFGQIIREGFTEVLGVQLHDHLRDRAAASGTFKAQMEAGIMGAPCPSPAAATIGYGAAGTSAEQIRSRVGDDRFRAAYFLGDVRLVGL